MVLAVVVSGGVDGGGRSNEREESDFIRTQTLCFCSFKLSNSLSRRESRRLS